MNTHMRGYFQAFLSTNASCKTTEFLGEGILFGLNFGTCATSIPSFILLRNTQIDTS